MAGHRASRRGISLLVVALTLVAPLVVAPDAFGKKKVHRAGIVVQHGDDQVVTECVQFKGKKTTGIDLLTASSFDMYSVTFPPDGRFVQYLDGEGLAPGDSFGSDFWGYWTQEKKEDTPTFSNTGASQRIVTNGDVDYYIWDDGDKTPTAKTFEEICD